MTIDLSQVFVLGLLTASMHWLIARSDIAKPLWSRARGRLDKLLRCPACSGFWLAIPLCLLGLNPVHFAGRVATLFSTSLLAVILTPVFEGVLLWGLERTAVGEAEDEKPN